MTADAEISSAGQAAVHAAQFALLAAVAAADILFHLPADVSALYACSLLLGLVRPSIGVNAAILAAAVVALLAVSFLKPGQDAELIVQRAVSAVVVLFTGAAVLFASDRWRNLVEREIISRTTLDSAVDGIILIDDSRKLLYLNQSAQRIFGYTPAEILGKNVNILMPEPYKAQHDGYVGNYLRTGERKIIGIGREVVGARKDGGTFPMDLAVSEVRSRAGRVFAGVVRDITDAKLAEARFQLAVEAAPNAMLMVDEKGAILLANAQAELLFGYTREQLLAMTIDDLVPERFRGGHPAMRGAYFADPETRAMGAGRDLFALRSDGAEFPVEIGLNPIRTDAGNFVLSAIVDITQRKRAEEAVRLRTRDLETIVYIVSHDLREPLRGISNLTSLFEKRYGEKTDEKGLEILGHIKSSAERLDRLILDLLELSRAQRSELPNDFVEGAVIMDDVLERLRHRIEAAGAVVAVHNTLPRLYVNRTWATQALYNLVHNALKFAGDGIAAEITVEACRIASGPRRGEGFVVLDRGPGVGEANRERIFALFQRAVDRSVEGTGAGLAIVREVAQRHNGWAWMEPRPDGGSAFYLIFGSKSSYEQSA